jgi:gamma-glutamylcyclotransferase (GGCT)/AIG2-like uncharacterized protein YtfP
MNKQPIPESIIFAVYGTLRQGHGNYKWCLEGKSEFLGEHKTEPAFTMHSLGGFPAVTADGETALTTELYRVTDPETIRGVFGLEGYTGEKDNPRNWYDTITIDTPHGPAEMFYFKKGSDAPVVASGDWNKRS